MINNLKLAKGVYSVGAVDWIMRDFHGYGTPRGITLETSLEASGLTIEPSAFALKWAANKEDKEKCFNFGLEFAKKVQANK